VFLFFDGRPGKKPVNPLAAGRRFIAALGITAAIRKIRLSAASEFC
jgi:hypothetical protein